MNACVSTPPERSAAEIPVMPRMLGINSLCARAASSVGVVPLFGVRVAITTAEELMLKFRTTGVTPAGRRDPAMAVSIWRTISLTSLP